MIGLLLTLSFAVVALVLAWLLTSRQPARVRWMLQIVLGMLLLGMLLPASALQWLQQGLGLLFGDDTAGPPSGMAAVAAHLTLFTLAGLLVGRLRSGVGWLAVAGFLATLAVMTEAMQHFSPGRQPSLLDVGYNLLGISLGLGLLLLLDRSTRRRTAPA